MLKNIKYCNLYEGNRKDFFFPSSKKRSRRGKIQKVLILSDKRTFNGQNSRELYRGQGERKKKKGVTVKNIIFSKIYFIIRR